MNNVDRQTDRSHLVVAMALQKSRKGQKPMELPSDVVGLLEKSNCLGAVAADEAPEED